MAACTGWSRLTPSELPSVGLIMPRSSYQASFLHDCSFRRPTVPVGLDGAFSELRGFRARIIAFPRKWPIKAHPARRVDHWKPATSRKKGNRCAAHRSRSVDVLDRESERGLPEEAADLMLNTVKGWAPIQNDDLTIIVRDYKKRLESLMATIQAIIVDLRSVPRFSAQGFDILIAPRTCP